MMRSLSIFVLFLIAPQFLHAQQVPTLGQDGTPYSSIAFGEPADLNSPASAGMGLRGVAVYDPYSVSSINPAMWGVSPYTQGSVTFGLNHFNATDGNQTAVYNHFAVQQFQLVLPLVRSRLGLSLGFFPKARTNFNLGSEGTLPFGSETTDYVSQIQGTGGVSAAEAGIGYRLSDHFAAGYAVSVHFASMDREYSTFFDSGQFDDLVYTEEMSGMAVGHRFGFFGRYSSLLSSGDELGLGGSVVLPVTIGLDRSMTSFRTIRNELTHVDLLPSGAVRSGEIEIPLEFNLGLTYNPSRLVNFSLEHQGQQWGSARYTLDSSQEEYLTNRSRWAFGTQFHPYRRDGASGLFPTKKYSLGVSYDTGYLEIAEQQIETVMFHAGIGFPAPESVSSADLSLHFGFRGTETGNLIRETIWGIKLSFNLAEAMFIPTRFQ